MFISSCTQNIILTHVTRVRVHIETYTELFSTIPTDACRSFIISIAPAFKAMSCVVTRTIMLTWVGFACTKIYNMHARYVQPEADKTEMYQVDNTCFLSTVYA